MKQTMTGVKLKVSNLITYAKDTFPGFRMAQAASSELTKMSKHCSKMDSFFFSFFLSTLHYTGL